MASLLERCADRIRGSLSCYDRVLIQGSLSGLCYAGGMTAFLKSRGIRIFDYPQFALPYRELIRENAERLARASGLEIEFIRSAKAFRKEQRIEAILARRGTHPGLVHVFSAMELCASYEPWFDKKTRRTYLRPDGGKCLH